MSAAEHDELVAPVVHAMRANLTAGMTLADMADVACLSPFHFHRQFQRFMGVSPGQFFTALRMEAAKQLLLTTTESAADVCFTVGYSSPGTFTTRFHQLVGVSPSAFRALPRMLEKTAFWEDGMQQAASWKNVDQARMGQIIGPDDFRGLIFIGAFAQQVPQARPLAGALRDRPGPYSLRPIADGTYFLLVAAVPATDPQSLLLPGEGLLVGMGAQPLVIACGHALAPVDVVLRRPRETDPPIVIALPLLLPQNSP